jgi:hypothetical protein
MTDALLADRKEYVAMRTMRMWERLAARAVPTGRQGPTSRSWLARLSFVGVAYAHGGVNALDVCAETCPSGLDSSGRCPDPQPTGFCSQTDDMGFFTVEGDMSGDLCVHFTDPDDSSFAPTACVRGVPQGAQVSMNGMTCSHGNETCTSGQVEMTDGMGNHFNWDENRHQWDGGGQQGMNGMR